MTEWDAIVVGAGVGGLCAAILLGGQGLRVLVLERGEAVGGKAGTIVLDGVEVDTGPSVLTLPDVFDDVFAAAGLQRHNELTLTTPNPGFRYLFNDGTELSVFASRDETVQSVARTLGSSAANEFNQYLEYSGRIWEAAAPHFVYSSAPELSKLLFGGLGKWRSLSRVDPLRTLSGAIDTMVKSPHLRQLLKRYATYNGSDARTAPATLGCIAHVELALGGFGVQGGMYELIRALERAARKVGVELRLKADVARITTDRDGVTGVMVAGETLRTRHVVANADVAHLTEDLLEDAPGLKRSSSLSMSAHSWILKALRGVAASPAHTVLFPKDYDAEFADIFDRRIVPRDPTIYLCAQESCHKRRGWDHHEPIFGMINAPALDDFSTQEPPDSIRARIHEKLVANGLASSKDDFAWWRTPAELAARFPGSRGSLYGAASNTMNAAFQRPANRASKIRGLYLASGSAHPGGGVPMVALSGKQAALAVIQDRRAAA